MSKTTVPGVIQRLIEKVNHSDDNPFILDAQAAPTGSRVICTPPVLDTDEDWLIFVPAERVHIAEDFLFKEGATHSEEQEHYPDGIVYWLGDLNIILLYDFPFYQRWVAATYWAHRFNIQSKEERKLFFSDLIDLRRTEGLVL